MDTSISQMWNDLQVSHQIEFFVIFKPSPGDTSTRELREYCLRRLSRKLMDYLGENAVYTIPVHYGFDPDEPLWQVDLGEHRMTQEENDSVPSGYKYLPVRVCSPRMRYGNSEEWRKILEQAMYGLRAFQDEERSLVEFNASTSHRVLICNPKGFSVDMAKAVLLLYYVTERAQDNLLGNSRIRHDNPHVVPTSQFIKDRIRKKTGKTDLSPPEMIKIIEQIDSEQIFDQFFGEDEKFRDDLILTTGLPTVNFANVFTEKFAWLPDNCMEFRQNLGTMNVIDLQCSTDLCCWIILAAEILNKPQLDERHTIYQNRLRSAIEDYGHQFPMGLSTFFDTLGLPDEIRDLIINKVGARHPHGGDPYQTVERWAFSEWETARPQQTAPRLEHLPIRVAFATTLFGEYSVSMNVDTIHEKERCGEYGWAFHR